MHRLIAASILLVLSASHAIAQPVRVLTLDSSRTSVCLTIDFNVLTGNAFPGMINELNNAGNFGPGGTVDREIVFVDQVSRLTADALAGCDVVLLSSMDGQARLEDCEKELLLDFVEAGGGLFSFWNNAPSEMGPLFGAVPAAASGNAVVTDPLSPATNGPFGPATGQLIMAFHNGFESVGPNGSPFVRSTQDLGATFEVGLGRAVLYADEESFMVQSVSGCAFATLALTQETIFLNAVAYVIPEPGFAFVGQDTCCPGDLADTSGFGPPDGMIDFGDFFALSFLSGACGTGTTNPGCTGDLADSSGFGPADGMIDFGDFFALSFLAGPCP